MLDLIVTQVQSVRDYKPLRAGRRLLFVATNSRTVVVVPDKGSDPVLACRLCEAQAGLADAATSAR
jgi:hypothetical protein